MSDQADPPSDDRIKPWTIKGISPEARNAAITAAERARQPIGEWVSRAIRSQVQSDHQESRTPVLGRVCKRRTFRVHDPILMG